MLFILQKVKETDPMYMDQMVLKNLIMHSHHSYQEMWISDFYDFEQYLMDKGSYPNEYQRAMPLGSIEFVNLYLNVFYNTRMNPIEIPEVLRNNEFLKREYKIVSYDDIPDTGKYFIKDVSVLKGPVHIGNRNNFNELDEKYKNDMYQVSEIIDIKSEYRVYFVDGKIYTIANYNGDPTIFPDIGLIQKANYIYSRNKNYPGSYTMDVAITDKGTCIIECHVLFSCGLYTTVLGSGFLEGYIDSLKYILHQ
jgi:hypothetical protein